MSNYRLKMISGLGIFCLLMVCQVGLAQNLRPPMNVSGRWSILSVSAFGKEEMKSLQISQQGNQIRGYFKGPNQSGPIAGFVNGRHIHFTTQTRVVLNFRGTVQGNTMSGTCGVRGRVGQWTATRFGSPNFRQ